MPPLIIPPDGKSKADSRKSSTKSALLILSAATCPPSITISNFAFSLLPLPGFTLPNFHSRRLEDIRHADPMPLLSPTFAGKSLPKFPRVTFLQGVAENLSAPTDFLLAFPFSPLYNTSHRTSFRKTLVFLLSH